MRILVVDDDPRQGESLAELLAAHGHEAYFAATDEEADWLSGLFRFDLSVIDFQLGELTGIDLARRLRRSSPDLDVVIVSGHGIETIGREILSDYQFFPKPLNPTEFLSFIERTGRRREGSPLMARREYPLGPPASRRPDDEPG